MTINEKSRNKLFVSGAFAGVLTPFFMTYLVMPVLNFLGSIVPAVSLKLAEGSNPAVSLSVRESLSGLNGGLSGWLVDALGLTVNVPGQTYLMGALGGGLLFVAGAYIIDAISMMNGNKYQKMRNVIFAGNAVAAIVIGGLMVPKIGISMLNTVISFTVNAVVLAWLFIQLDKQFKIDLFVPF
jgi:hypothetical protein